MNDRPIPTLGPDLYDGWRESDLGTITEALEDRLLFELTGAVDGLRILEVGCGEGRLAISLGRKGARVTAVDPSLDMLKAAAANIKQTRTSIDLIQAEGARLPFADASFDLVLAKTVLCFVADARPMIDEMVRILRPGGRFVIGELHKWSSWSAQRRLRAWFGSALWRRGRFRTAGELRRLAETAGLQVETVRGAIYYPRVTAAARLMAPWDSRLSRLTTAGAAFLGMAAVKPAAGGP